MGSVSRPGGHRRLLALLAAAMVVDTAGYSAITPLLPELVSRFGLGQAGAGLLAATYPVGTLALALPAAWLVARTGPRRVTLGGLVLLAVAALGFALAGTAPLLAAARLAQGVGAAALWAAALAWAIAVAPAGRRSETIGTVTGAAIVGAVGGPALGVLADWFGVGAVFGTFVAVPLVLAVLVARYPGPAVVTRTGSLPEVRSALREPHVRTGALLMLVPSVGFGVLNLLVPLRLGAAGWAAGAIGAAFLVAAVTEAAASPLAGRAGDRHGPAVPAAVCLALTAAVLALLAPTGSPWTTAALVPLTAAAMGALWTPAMTLLSGGAEQAGLDPAYGFGVANLLWGAGAALGNLGGGAAAEAVGGWVAFVVVAAAAAVGSLVLVRRATTARRPPAGGRDRAGSLVLDP